MRSQALRVPPSPACGTATTQTGTAAQTIGGGIAGVASKLEQDGIKIYNDQKSYNKWEFVYDITKDPARTGGTVPQAAPLRRARRSAALLPGRGNYRLTGTRRRTTHTAPNITTPPTPAAPPPVRSRPEETQRIVAVFCDARSMQRAVFVRQRESRGVLDDRQPRRS